MDIPDTDDEEAAAWVEAHFADAVGPPIAETASPQSQAGNVDLELIKPPPVSQLLFVIEGGGSGCPEPPPSPEGF